MIGQIIRTGGKRFRERRTSDSSGNQYVVTWGIHPLAWVCGCAKCILCPKPCWLQTHTNDTSTKFRIATVSRDIILVESIEARVSAKKTVSLF